MGKQRWHVGDLSVLDFLRNTYVGRAAPPVEESYESESSEADQEGIEERRVGRSGELLRVRSKRSSDPRASDFLSIYNFLSPWCGLRVYEGARS